MMCKIFIAHEVQGHLLLIYMHNISCSLVKTAHPARAAKRTGTHLDDGGWAFAQLEHRLHLCAYAARLAAHLAAPHRGDAHVEHVANERAECPAQAAEVRQHVLRKLQWAIGNTCVASRPCMVAISAQRTDAEPGSS